MQLESFASGRWHHASQEGRPLHNAIDGEVIAHISSDGLDFGSMLHYARAVGGSALRKLTFHQRAMLLKALAQHLMEQKETFYETSYATGATRKDAWIDIDGGISTLFVYSSKGRREMPNGHVYIDGPPEPLSRGGGFVGQHICVPLHGAGIHINAYNFPCWGMLEKLAPCLLAGVPAIVKPASSTSFLTERMFRSIVDSGILPEGSIQLICGGVGDLFDHLTCQDSVAFTGSATTGQMLRQHPRVIDQSVRFTMEADSLNCSILGSDCVPGEPEWDLYVKEVAREMVTKAGQKCTAIRRAIVPRESAAALLESLQARLADCQPGNPMLKETRLGALASQGQRTEVRERVALLERHAERVYGDPDQFQVAGADAEKGAFLPPMLLYCDDPTRHPEVHSVEAFGPVCTVMPYDDLEQAAELANAGQGSLVGSIFTGDDEIARELVLGTATYHGRLLVVNRDCAKESTGHGSPLPHLIHGGPGRAGGGEEMGGIRGVLHYMQRTALQGSPTTLTRITDRFISGAATRESDEHPFRRYFEELQVGDTINTPARRVTLEDIERFADLTGDRFYAHMSEDDAKANPFFDGRVAHGYFIVSAAAGLFVDPAPGPVLANYGLDDLRFTQPVYPDDELKVAFTCKQKTAREGEGHGEVRWDVNVTNQDGVTVAGYDILTMVARQEG